jgi:hypothetical protein
LIHNYYGFKIKWLILSVLLEIRICELICYGLRNLFYAEKSRQNGLKVEDDEILFWYLIYEN